MPADLSPAEVEYQKKVAVWAQVETAYARLQSLRPETLTPALNDSSIALASWFIEKFQRWGDCAEGINQSFGRDTLLDNLSLKRRGLAPERGFVVLDGSPQPGGAWQFRWPSLKLSTVNRIHDLLVYWISQLARSSGAADAARSWRRHHDEWQIGHTGRKGPQDSFGRLRLVCVDDRCKSSWRSRGK